MARGRAVAHRGTGLCKVADVSDILRAVASKRASRPGALSVASPNRETTRLPACLFFPVCEPSRLVPPPHARASSRPTRRARPFDASILSSIRDMNSRANTARQTRPSIARAPRRPRPRHAAVLPCQAVKQSPAPLRSGKRTIQHHSRARAHATRSQPDAPAPAAHTHKEQHERQPGT